MRRPFLWLAVCGALALVGCRSRVAFRSSAGSVSPAALAPGWFDVRPPDAGFACRMPGLPRIQTLSGHDEDGAGYQTVRARASLPYGTFGMFVTEWEGGFVGDPLTHSRELARSIVEHLETPDHRAARVRIPGFYAREDIGHTPDGGFFAMRQFVGRDRIYVAITAVRDDAVGLRAAEQFMQSIALDRRDALLPYGESTAPVPLYLPDVDFAVNMPPIASRRSSEVEVDGVTTKAWVFESNHPDGHFRVTVLRFPEGPPEGALEHVAEALSLGRADRHVHASGYPGMTYAAAPDRRVRAFVTSIRVYVLEVAGADALGSRATDAFFDSFRIL
jgi:hypothetical protein